MSQADRIPVRTIVLVFVSLQSLAFIGAGRLGEPFYLVMIGLLLLVTFVPEISLALPQWLLGYGN